MKRKRTQIEQLEKISQLVFDAEARALNDVRDDINAIRNDIAKLQNAGRFKSGREQGGAEQLWAEYREIELMNKFQLLAKKHASQDVAFARAKQAFGKVQVLKNLRRDL